MCARPALYCASDERIERGDSLAVSTPPTHQRDRRRRKFFEYAFVLTGNRQPGFLNSIEKRGTISFYHVGMKHANLLQFFPDRFQTMNQILGQMFAFALAHFD